MLWNAIDNFMELRLTTDTSRAGYRSRLGAWFRHLDVVWGAEPDAARVLAATGTDFENFVKSLRKRRGQKPRSVGISESVSDRTIYSYKAAVKSMYQFLIRKRFLQFNPVDEADIKLLPYRNKKRPTTLIPFDKVQAMIHAVELQSTRYRDRAYIALSFASGVRRGEIHNLKIGNVKRNKDGDLHLWLQGTKNGEDEDQAVAPFAWPHIEKYLEQRRHEGARDADYLFASRDGSQLGYHTLYQRFKRICELVGLDPRQYSPHSTRATGITKLLDDGVPHREVQAFSRHSSIQMVELYDKRFLGVSNSPAKGLNF